MLTNVPSIKFRRRHKAAHEGQPRGADPLQSGALPGPWTVDLNRSPGSVMPVELAIFFGGLYAIAAIRSSAAIGFLW